MQTISANKFSKTLWKWFKDPTRVEVHHKNGQDMVCMPLEDVDKLENTVLDLQAKIILQSDCKVYSQAEVDRVLRPSPRSKE